MKPESVQKLIEKSKERSRKAQNGQAKILHRPKSLKSYDPTGIRTTDLSIQGHPH